MYLDNFIGFEVGTTVPSGYYDRALLTCTPTADGRVRRFSMTAWTSTATVPLTLWPATSSSRIRRAFDVGAQFWRVPIDHFSPSDLDECGWQHARLPGDCLALCTDDLRNGRLASAKTGRTLHNMRPDAFPSGGLHGRL